MSDERRPRGLAKAVDNVDDTSGKPNSSSQSATSIIVSGVCSAGLRTQVQPAAIAGASFQEAITSG